MIRFTRRFRFGARVLSLALLAWAAMPLDTWAQGRGGVLRIGMTAADIPYTGGQPDQGFEGFRFIGNQLYDPLARWDLSQGERLPSIVPGLAESWEVRADDPTKAELGKAINGEQSSDKALQNIVDGYNQQVGG